LETTDFELAATLLAEGFPEHGAAFWKDALARLARYAGNAEAEFPLGFLLFTNGDPAGIALTPASVRPGADGTLQRIVNVSSWYMRPAYRWRAGTMLRGILADESVIYTDFTPTEDVQKMLPAFGMTVMNTGALITPLPLLTFHPSRGGTMRPLGQGDGVPPGSPRREMIELYRELGCEPALLCSEKREDLIIAKPSTFRGMPAAKIMFASSNAALWRHSGAVARHFMRSGYLFLITDRRIGEGSGTGIVRPRGIWFARGSAFEDRTDLFGSELCILET
jgi:hypothetical protein